MIKLSSLITEAMSRGGTINDSFYNIANTADEIEGDNDGKDTYPIEVKRYGASADGKTYEEIEIRYGQGPNDYFSIYDYKFGEDPTSEENYQKDYPFSIGVPTGNKDALRYAMKLGFKVDGMPKSDDEMGDDEREDFYMNLDSVDEVDKKPDGLKEEEGFTEVSEEEIKFHLDAYKAGNIDGDDLAQAIEEIVFGETKAPGMEEGTDRPGYHKDGTPKSNDEMSDDEREEFYLNLDSVDENLKEHFARFK